MARDREPEDADRELQITMTPPVTAVTPMPPSPPGADVSAWGPGAPTGIPNVAVPSDPSGTTQITQRPQTAFDRIVPGSALSGHFDAWVGEVITTFPGGDPIFNDTNSISVRRVIVQWGTNNAPSSDDAPRAWSQPATGPVIARPFPPRHDQPKYIAAGTDVASVGDIVTVITGTDGLHWYIMGELGFVGKVVKKASSVKEDEVGGAGLLSLKVRWQSITGDPDDGGFDGATLADLLDAEGATIDFSPVLIIKPDEQQHGYRVGDSIWVMRRGRYFFAEAAQEMFVAKVEELGPDGEADFANWNYWVQEQSGTVDYTVGGSDSDYSLSLGVRNAAGPDGGRELRWVQARNIGEESGQHNILTNGTVAVIVHIFADPSGGNPFYLFDHKPLGTADTPAVILPATFETEAAQVDTWDRNAPPVDKDGVSVRIQTRTAYNDLGDEILYAFFRTFIFDSAGGLLTISAETRVTVDTPEICVDLVTDEEYKSILALGGII